MARQMDKRKDGMIDGQTNRQKDGQTGKQYRWTDIWMDGQTDRQMYRWTD